MRLGLGLGLSGPSGARAFDPSPLYDLGALHLDMSDVATLFTTNAAETNVASDDDLVGYIADLSGNGYHYSAADANRATWKDSVQNGRGVVRFDATNDYFDGLKKGLTRARTTIHCIAVIQLAPTAGVPIFFSNGTSGSTRFMVNNAASSKLGFQTRHGDGSSATSRTNTQESSGFIIAHVFADYVNGFTSMYVNGAWRGVAQMSASSVSTANTDEVIVRLGTTTASGSWFGGDLAEIFVVPAAIPSHLLSSLYQHLRTKWGISAAAPTLWSPSGPIRTAWTWFNDQRAIMVGPDHYVVGGISGTGDEIVADINGDVIKQTVLRAFGVPDDHNNGSILKRASDNKLLYLFMGHGEGAYYQHVSTNANDGSTWSAVTGIGTAMGHSNYSYTNSYQVSSGRIYNFYRATNTVTEDLAWHCSYTDDDGANWSVGIQISGPARPYHRFALHPDGDRIDFIRNDGHPNITATNSLYHGYLLDTEGSISWHDSAGGDAGSPPFDGEDLTMVWDGTVARSWTWGISYDGDDNPVLSFAVFPGSTDEVADDHRYYQARWNGTGWDSEEICAAGGSLYSAAPYYSGGVHTDPENPDVAYVSRQVDANGEISTSGVHQLFKAERTEPGVWTLTQLTFGSQKCFRPFIPLGSRRLFYVTGPRYAHYVDFDTRIEWIDID